MLSRDQLANSASYMTPEVLAEILGLDHDAGVSGVIDALCSSQSKPVSTCCEVLSQTQGRMRCSLPNPLLR
jgi:hypothetical protein